MATTVSISPFVLETLTSGKWSGQGVTGFLIGGLDSGCTLPQNVLGAWQSRIIDTNELKEDIDQCLGHFPGGRNVVGLVLLPSSQSIKSIIDDDKAGIDREFEEVFGNYNKWLEQMGLTEAIVLCLWRVSPDRDWQPAFFMMNEDGVTKAIVNYDFDTKPITRMRLKADIPLIISAEPKNEEQMKSALDHELMKLQNHSVNGSFVFGFNENKVLLQGTDSAIGVDAQGWSTCGDIGKYFSELDGGTGNSGRKRGGGAQLQAPVPVSMLQLVTMESSTSHQFAPIIRHQMGSFKSTHLSIPLDVLIDVEDSSSLSQLYGVLSKAVNRLISAVFECLSLYTQKNKLHSPEIFHFKPPQLDTPVTVVYPKGATEKELEKEREILCQNLCLPTDQPLLRRSAAGFFLHSTTPAGYLLNPHIGLQEPSVKSASVSLVHGYYSYHHYMQDHFDDDKWGCAYRSLQTIVSWFKYQGYTEKEVPSHRDIQQALCDIGDKEKKFVGSKQWIGSFEVSYVLDHLLGVTSKFINVNAGSELSTTGQQLANHFQTQGTPVMIGGGVFAHTILGVAYCELTGEINFLILDPHYTGGEDIRTIQDKGWCGWKDMSFWNQTAHYNMCLPQRPKMI